MENPWNIQSIYELQFFNCPSCIFKNQFKQELINHAYEFHPDSIEFLMNINDESLNDIVFPSIDDIDIKHENLEGEVSSNVEEKIGEDPLTFVKVEYIKTEPEVHSETFEEELSYMDDSYIQNTGSVITNCTISIKIKNLKASYLIPHYKKQINLPKLGMEYIF